MIAETAIMYVVHNIYAINILIHTNEKKTFIIFHTDESLDVTLIIIFVDTYSFSHTNEEHPFPFDTFRV